MSLGIINQPFCALDRGLIMVTLAVDAGAGAITAVYGKGFTSGAPSGEQGGVTRTGAGVWQVTLPGRGGLVGIIPVSVAITDTAAADVRHTLFTAVNPTARTVDITFFDADTPAATDPTSGSYVDIVLLVKETSVS